MKFVTYFIALALIALTIIYLFDIHDVEMILFCVFSLLISTNLVHFYFAADYIKNKYSK